MDYLFQNLDPSLFQNVIIGILMILIFIGGLILSEVKTQQKRGEFSKMVIFYEIFNITTTVIIAISSIFIFSFFKNSIISEQIHSVSLVLKIITTAFTLFVAFLLIMPILKFQLFFRGKKYKFEINFLKSLNFSKIFKFKNQTKAEKMIRAWNSFFSTESEFNEREFTKIFMSHINDTVNYKQFDISVQLAQTYVKNIEKRDQFSVGYDVLPKILELSEVFWNEHQFYLKRYDIEEKIQKFVSHKYFPKFLKKLILNTHKKIIFKKDYFWNWDYFNKEFFQAIIKKLLQNRHNSYEIFSSFKKHIKKSEKKLEKIENEDDKERYWGYLKDLFSNFCQAFFNEINKTSSSYSIWKHDFPAEWKISTANKGKLIPGVILYEFLEWSKNRLFKKDSNDFDEGLTEVINGIFSNIHPLLFEAFLRLFFSWDIKQALEKESNFYISNIGISWTSSVEETKEERDRRINKMTKETEISQKKETIQIILNFFNRYWEKLKITLDSNNEKNWKSANKREKEMMLKEARKKKLTNIKEKIKSKEIKKFCEDSEKKEIYRKSFLELINLLLEEIK